MKTRIRFPFSASVVAALATCALPLAAACGVDASDSFDQPAGKAVTDVPQTPRIKNQAIGNCWIYATGTWVESLHKTAAHEDFNTSESYWTYLDWFQKITQGQATQTSIREGGSFWDSSQLIQRFGLVAEKDFIAADVSGETSHAQGAAETAINASLKDGALKTADARANPATVRAKLDKAFGLDDATKAMLTTAFGATLQNNFADGTADATGTAIIVPTAFSVAYTSGPGTSLDTKTLLDATTDWQTVSYSSASHRSFEKRFQRALQDEQPVIMAWFVDFNDLDGQGRFIIDPANPKPPGAGGGHMVVMKDYQVSNVPGFGTLPVGVLVTDPNAFAAALDDAATIDFIRIKNSWGTLPPDVTTMPGYYDLYMNYLEVPIEQCDENDAPLPDGGVDLSKCRKAIPFEDVTLPPGY